MSIVTIGVGQCGCQLAGEFMASSFKYISNLHSSPKENFNQTVFYDGIQKFWQPSEKNHHNLAPRGNLNHHIH